MHSLMPSLSVVSYSLLRYGLWSCRPLCPRDAAGKNTRSGLPCPPPGALPDPGSRPVSPAAPALAGEF